MYYTQWARPAQGPFIPQYGANFENAKAWRGHVRENRIGSVLIIQPSETFDWIDS